MAVLVAVLLGPWAAVIAVSIALLIQALFFGDGGVLAYGANVVNMAFVMPFVGYGVYRLLARQHVADVAAAGRSPPVSAATSGSTRRRCARHRVRDPARPLPHGRRHAAVRAVPPVARRSRRWLFAHLTVAGVVEFALTAGVVAYLQRANLPLLRINHPAVPETDADMPRAAQLGWRWAFVGLAAMAVLDAARPARHRAAFGEDAPDDLDLGKYHLNAVPSGLRHYAGFWHNALFDGYDFDRRHIRPSATSSRRSSARRHRARRHRPLRRGPARAALPGS